MNRVTDYGTHELDEYTLVGVAQRAADLLSIRRCAPLALTLTCERNEAPTDGQLRRLLSLEEHKAQREAWTNHDMDRLLCFEEDVRVLRRQLKAPLAILPYCATPGWERLAQDQSLGARFAAIPANLKGRLDDKGWVRGKLARAHISVPRTLVLSAADLDWTELIQHLGEPLVLQRPIGSCGHGTYLVRSNDDFLRIRSMNPSVARWVVSAYSGDCTVNVHGLILGDRVEVSAPSIQLTGISELASAFGAYCGNDFGAPAALDPSTRTEIRSLVEQTGVWLASIGYRGLFGVDVAVGAAPHILEINPRMQGSTWLLGEIEWEAGNVPMAVAHFSHLLGRPCPPRSSEVPPAAGAQMLLHWQGRRACRMKTSMRCGIYALGDRDRLEFRRPAGGLIECEEEEILILGLPAQGRTMTIYPRAVLARIAARVRMANGDGRALTEIGRRIAAAVKAELIPWSDGALAPVS